VHHFEEGYDGITSPLIVTVTVVPIVVILRSGSLIGTDTKIFCHVPTLAVGGVKYKSLNVPRGVVVIVTFNLSPL